MAPPNGSSAATSSPLTAADAHRALDDARTRDAVFESVLRAMLARTECAALFTIHGKTARGRLGLGVHGFDRDRISAEFALASAPDLAAAAATGAPGVAVLGPNDPLSQMLETALGTSARSALLLPIQLRSRVIAIAVAGSGDELALASFTDLLPLATGAADALARVIATAKRDQDGSAPGEPDDAPAPRAAEVLGRDELEQHAIALQAAERWQELAQTLTQLAEVTPERGRRRAVLQRLARVLAERLGDPETAVALRERAETLSLPTELAELERLCQECRDDERWEELVEALEAMLERGSADGSLTRTELVGLLTELAHIEVGQLGHVDGAIEAWHRVLALEPNALEALEALEPLLASRERWQECVEVVGRRGRAQLATAGDPGAGIESLLRAAELLETRLGDEASALEIYREIRQHDPAHPVACDRLIDAYRRGERWPELAEVLLERAQRRDDVHDRIDLLREIAAIYETRIGDPAGAFIVTETALGDDPMSRELADELHRLAELAETWDELAAAQEARAEALASQGESEEAIAAWLDAARCHRDRRGDLAAAERCVAAATERAPTAAGLAELAEIQRTRGDEAALAETLRRQAELTDDAEQRAELWLTAADLYETALGQPYDAISAYAAALETDAHSVPALVSLERLYREHEMWEQLIDVLTRATELRADDRDEVIRLKRTIAETWDRHLQERDRAIAAYEELVELTPDDAEVLRALEDLYEASGSAEAYLDVLERRLDRAQTNDERVRLYQRLASVWENDLERPDRAAACLEKLAVVDGAGAEHYRRLIKLYRDTGDHEALLEAYRGYVEVLEEPLARVDALCTMAELCEQELGDAEAACECYDRVLEIEPEEPRALEALGRLREQQGAFDRAADHLETLRATTQDPAMRADLCLRIAQIALDQLSNQGLAEQRLEEALELQPDLVPALERLAALDAARRSWPRAAELYARAGAAEPNPDAAAALHREAARIAQDQLGDAALARAQLAAAVERSPGDLEAADRLAALHEDALEWSALADLVERMRPAAKAAGWPAERQAGLAERAARAALALGDGDAALGHYDAALALTPGSAALLRARSDLLYANEDWAAAAAAYRALMVHGAESEAERARIYYRIGHSLAQAGEPGKAVDMLRRCLSIDSGNRDALTALADVAEKQRDWASLIDAKRELAAGADSAERVRLLEQIGDLYRERLASAPKALGAYLEGLEKAPHDHRLLQRALELHTELEQWQPAIGVIETFLELESDPQRQAPYHRAAAAICRQKLNDLERSLGHLESALDAYLHDAENVPEGALQRALEAFREIDEMLTAQRDWKAQEKAYRRMLRRVPQSDQKLAVALWDGLGEIYRSRLKLYQSALEAYGVAQRLAPTPERAVILSELSVVAGPEAGEQAFEQLDEVLRRTPRQVEPYRALFALYRKAGDTDAAWCVSAALVQLGEARSEEQAFHDQHRPRNVPTARQRMSHEMWSALRAPEEDRYIGTLFAAIHEVAAQTTAQPHRAFELKRKDKIDLEAEDLREPRLIRYVADALGVTRPELFVQANRPGGLLLAHCGEKRALWPALVLRADFAQRRDREAVFLTARRLAVLRPERFLQMAMPTNKELKIALIAAIAAVRSDFAVPAEIAPRVATLAGSLREQLPPAVLEQLGELVTRVIERAPQLDVSSWSRGATLTAQRVGLLLCGDLRTATRLLEAEPPPPGGPPGPRDDILQLTAFSVSRPYLSARRQLGLAIS